MPDYHDYATADFTPWHIAAPPINAPIQPGAAKITNITVVTDGQDPVGPSRTGNTGFLILMAGQTPCIDCGKLKDYRSTRCVRCRLRGKKRYSAKTTDECPECGGPKNVTAKQCWDCYHAARSHGACIVDGCGKQRMANGLCRMHYGQVRKHGRVIRVSKPTVQNKDLVCSADGCDRVVRAKGLCHMHYRREKFSGSLADPSTPGRAGYADGTKLIWPRKSRRALQYVIVKDPSHPNCMHSVPGWVREDVKIASQMIGRPIEPDERVVHVNGNTLDSDHRNLLVVEKKRLRLLVKCKGCGKVLSRPHNYDSQFPTCDACPPQYRGERMHFAKLSEADAVSIRNRRLNKLLVLLEQTTDEHADPLAIKRWNPTGTTVPALVQSDYNGIASEYGITRLAAYFVGTGRTWGHLPLEPWKEGMFDGLEAETHPGP